MKRNGFTYGLMTTLVMLTGLASRRFFGDVAWVKLYVGDVPWALMVFLGFGLLFRHWSTKNVALAAVLFSFAIEISQLYHVPWIDKLRATSLGALILGFSFVWSDFVCYSLGVGLGVLIERRLETGKRKNGEMPVV